MNLLTPKAPKERGTLLCGGLSQRSESSKITGWTQPRSSKIQPDGPESWKPIGFGFGWQQGKGCRLQSHVRIFSPNGYGSWSFHHHFVGEILSILDYRSSGWFVAVWVLCICRVPSHRSLIQWAGVSHFLLRTLAVRMDVLWFGSSYKQTRVIGLLLWCNKIPAIYD